LTPPQRLGCYLLLNLSPLHSILSFSKFQTLIVDKALGYDEVLWELCGISLTTKMLPPFQIRHLKASTNPSGPDLGDDYLSSPVDTGVDATISINRHQYDDILHENPEAALTYVDEDDGEVITVSYIP
jgi:hypothetical protein